MHIDWQLVTVIGLLWTTTSFLLGMLMGSAFHRLSERDDAIWAAWNAGWRPDSLRSVVLMEASKPPVLRLIA